MPCRRAVVDDVLARGQARVEAARVREHAHPREHLARAVATSMPSTAHRPASGAMSAASMRSVVVLPAPFGPSRPVIEPFGASNADVAHGVDARLARRAPAAPSRSCARAARAHAARASPSRTTWQADATSIIAVLRMPPPRRRAAETPAAAARSLRTRRRRQARRASLVASMKRNRTSRMQPIAEHAMAGVGDDDVARHRPECASDALGVARRRRRIDAAAQQQRPAPRSSASCRTPPAPRRAASPRTSARRSARIRCRSRAPGRRREAPGAARPRRRRPRSACRSRAASSCALAKVAFSADQAGEVAARRRVDRRRQRGRERRRVERAAHGAEQHVAAQRRTALAAPGERVRGLDRSRQATASSAATWARRSGCVVRARGFGGAGASERVERGLVVGRKARRQHHVGRRDAVEHAAPHRASGTGAGIRARPACRTTRRRGRCARRRARARTASRSCTAMLVVKKRRSPSPRR